MWHSSLTGRSEDEIKASMRGVFTKWASTEVEREAIKTGKSLAQIRVNNARRVLDRGNEKERN